MPLSIFPDTATIFQIISDNISANCSSTVFQTVFCQIVALYNLFLNNSVLNSTLVSLECQTIWSQYILVNCAYVYFVKYMLAQTLVLINFFLVRCSLSWIVAMGLPSTKLPAFLISLAIFEMSFSFMVDFDPLCKKGLLETGEG